MDGLEHGGTWADKWDFWPPPEDPYIPVDGRRHVGGEHEPVAVVARQRARRAQGRGLGATGVGGRGRRERRRRRRAGRRRRWRRFGPQLQAGADRERAPGRRGARHGRPMDHGRPPPSLRREPELLLRGDDDGRWGGASDAEHPRIASPASSRAGDAEPSASLRLESITPNPARAGSTIRFSTPSAAAVSIVVYDAAGRRIRELFSGTVAAGAHEASWDRRDSAGRSCRTGSTSCSCARERTCGARDSC